MPNQYTPSTLAIWDYFARKSGDDKIAKCKTCSKNFSYRTSVTNLKTHLKVRHRALYRSFLEDSDPSTPRLRATLNTPFQERKDILSDQHFVTEESQLKTETVSDYDISDNDSIIAFEVTANEEDGDEKVARTLFINTEETIQNNLEDIEEVPLVFESQPELEADAPLSQLSDAYINAPASSIVKRELALRIKFLKQEHKGRVRRARERHALEMRILKEKLREAKALADLAVRRLS